MKRDGPGIPIVVVFVVLAILIGCIQTPASDPAAESDASVGIRTVGSAACAECHQNHYDLWSYGGHGAVSCERCHGQGRDHVDAAEPMVLPGKAALCLSCHGRAESGEADPPQVGGLEAHLQHVSEKHTAQIDRSKINGRCVFCHDPHSLQ